VQHFLSILKYAKPYKARVVLSIICHILMVLFSLGSVTILIPILNIIFENTQAITNQPVWSGIVNIRVYLQDSLNFWITHHSALSGKQQVLFYVLCIAACFFILKNIFRYLGARFLIYIKNGVERDLRNDIHHKLMYLPLPFFSEKRKGDIVSRLTTDILEIQWALLSSIKRFVEDPLMIITTLIVMLIMSPKLTMFVLVLIPFTGIIITSISTLLKKPSAQAKEEMGNILSLAEEHIGALPIIKSYTAEEKTQERFENSNQRHFGFMNKMLYRRDLSSPISEVMGSMVVLAIIWFGSKLIIEDQALEPEMFITYIALFYQIINPAKSLSVAFYDIKRSEASVQRINEILHAQNPLLDGDQQNFSPTFNNTLSLSNVSFAYDEKVVVKNFSLEIKKGEVVALVGQSGSGKSTIAYLLNRFYDPTSGTIKIDDQDYKKINLKELRSQIGYISQDAILFYGTVLENLKFGNFNASKETIVEACKIANAYGFIQELEKGFDTMIGDRGLKLSGGQRQRLTIARAILNDPAILVLDEATSALDAESEKLVQAALNAVMKGRTAIVIAHRLSTIQKADKIIVLENGSIQESGTHQDLIAQNGIYQKLVELQSI